MDAPTIRELPTFSRSSFSNSRSLRSIDQIKDKIERYLQESVYYFSPTLSTIISDISRVLNISENDIEAEEAQNCLTLKFKGLDNQSGLFLTNFSIIA